MTSTIDYTSPTTQFSFDVNASTLFKKDAYNYINVLGIKQLNTLENTSLLDIFLSKSNVVEPHYHQNAAELVYCITGAAVVSIINPFTNELMNFPINPGMVANVPQGWWHYEIATVDGTHLLAIFDAPTPEVILGSDILLKTPASVWAHTYCMDEAKVKETFAPVRPRTFIGPPKDCAKGVKGVTENAENVNIPAYVSPQTHIAPQPNAAPLPNMAPQPFGYSPYAAQGHYAPPYVTQYREQPYYQSYPYYPSQAITE
ncbi:cupin domain-containing protein ['Paenibacillus yunnanensis' Narsing Rao et al. 2020]|uniref:cupin domain-containing protein n=1 Tax=Paenibacillus tengchongensis TaxID=2608684 RepID=UPI00124EDCB1|nr:cupin domain-containing protein [Paenibacillus tengchongensis]